MQKSNLTLSLLQTFAVVAEMKNMVRACDVLHVTQPAISMQLSRLTEIVGGKLFYDTKTYELTDLGHRVLADSKLIIDMVHKLKGMGIRPAIPRVNVGFSIDAFEFAQHIVTQEFSSDHLLHIHCMSSGETLAAAADGCLDLAVVFLPPSYSGPSVSEIPCRLVLSQPADECSDKGQPSNLTLATYGETCPYRLTTLKYLAGTHIAFNHTMTASSPASLHEMMKTSKAHAPFPLFLRRRRYFNNPYRTDIDLPSVRLALVSNHPTFRHLNQLRLWRIAANLRTAVQAAESENQIAATNQHEPEVTL